MRFQPTHRHTSWLVDRLGLHTEPLPSVNPQNMAYLRGRRLRIGELTDWRKLPYALAPDERSPEALANLTALAAVRALGNAVPVMVAERFRQLGVRFTVAYPEHDISHLARHLILAMPRRSIELLDQTGPLPSRDNPWFRSMLESVTPIPLLKIGLCCETCRWESAVGPDASGKSITDLPSRQVCYWKKDPSSRRIIRPREDLPLYVCGEAWSQHLQGWVEGALITAESMLQEHFGLRDPLAGQARPGS